MENTLTKQHTEGSKESQKSKSISGIQQKKREPSIEANGNHSFI